MKELFSRKRRYVGGVILLLGLVVLVSGLFLYRAWMNAPIELDKTITVEIEKGMTGRQIGRLLKKKGAIDSVSEFRWALWFQRAERDLKLGTVRLNPSLTMETLVQTLRRKSPLMTRVQIPEGWPSWKIYRRLSRRLNLPRRAFRELHDDRSFLDRLNVPGQTLEGYLFPDTYNISVDGSARDVLAQIVRRFRSVARRINLEHQAETVSLSFDQAVTLASIIEREVRVDEERPIVSAVYHNRLRRDMKLQADPTLLYELKDFEHPIFRSTLNRQSPYNTYKVTGLPPTPICNPGKKSLEASVTPADVPYLYFVSKGNGRHVFSSSVREHRKAVEKYQR